jgi:hypothetical protein
MEVGGSPENHSSAESMRRKRKEELWRVLLLDKSYRHEEIMAPLCTTEEQPRLTLT